MKKVLLFILLGFVTLMVGCSASIATTISPADAKAMLESDESVVLVDVRTEAEFRESRIPGSILIPLATLETEAPIKMANKNTTYIIYCRSGNRSNTALEILKDMGYTKLYDLGGIIDWPYDKISG